MIKLKKLYQCCIEGAIGLTYSGKNIDLQKDDIFELDDETYIMLDNRNYEPYESNLEKGINILKTIKETIPFI